MYSDIYKPLIGKKTEEKPFYLSADAISRFAGAVDEKDPVYFDAEYAKSLGYDNVIAPPTYSFTFPYPKVEGIWLPPYGLIHGTEEFEYHKPLVGDRFYYLQGGFADAYEKEGKNGTMIFIVLENSVLDDKHELCVSAKMTIIARDNLFEKFKDQIGKSVDEEKMAPLAPAKFDDFEVGYEFPVVTLPAFTRPGIAKYAGVSTDFNTIHLDDEAAKSVKFKGIIAHGMYSYARLNKVVGEWLGGVGNFKLENINTKFASPTYVGETPEYHGKIVELDKAAKKVAIEFTVVGQLEGSVLLAGKAEATMK